MICVIVVLLSSLGAVLSYLKAHRLHLRIEDIHPGFNRFMRNRCKRP